MKSVKEVFAAAMALMDELDGEGKAQTRDTKEYEKRTPGIMETLMAEKRLFFGERGSWAPIESMEDEIAGADDVYAMGVMQYGLAAKLLIDENPRAASFYHEKYEENRRLYALRERGEIGKIEDLYGGIEYGEFSRWK